MKSSAALALVAVVLLSGCFEPHRAHVDAAVFARASGWVETREALDSDGWLGPKSVETRYVYDLPDNNPPFDAVLQVFSVREFGSRSTGSLLDLARRLVEDAAIEQNIDIRAAPPQEGKRELANGVKTRFLTWDGTVSSAGAIFSSNDDVRIVAEVGHDGRSDTSVVGVGIAQVEREVNCPLPVACQPQHDETTWIRIVGDPDGSIGGATLQDGFLYHLDTR